MYLRVLQEWFKFVDHEKVLREGLEAQLAALAGEAAQLKLHSVAQVAGLRSELNAELSAIYQVGGPWVGRGLTSQHSHTACTSTNQRWYGPLPSSCSQQRHGARRIRRMHL